MTNEQTRLNNGLDSLIEIVAKLQNRIEQLTETVDAHTAVLTLARDCAGRQQTTIEAMGDGFADIDGKLRTLDSNDATLQAELLRQRGELARIAGAGAGVITHEDLN